MVDILIVDDDRLTRAILRRMFTSVGYTVMEADNGLDGLDLLEAESPQEVLLDLHMPRMDGIAFARQLQLLPSIDPPHLIFMSASVPIHPIDVGQRATLSKPFDVEQLLGLVAELVPPPYVLPVMREQVVGR